MAKKKTKTEVSQIKENIIDMDIMKEFEQSFIDYAQYVNKDRAIPDAIDGLFL